jgi:hypothetical protein
MEEHHSTWSWAKACDESTQRSHARRARRYEKKLDRKFHVFVVTLEVIVALGVIAAVVIGFH